MGDVGAGHHQYEGHATGSTKQRTNVADDEFAQTLDVNLMVAFSGMGSRQDHIDRLHFGNGLCLGDPGARQPTILANKIAPSREFSAR